MAIVTNAIPVGGWMPDGLTQMTGYRICQYKLLN